MNTKKLFLSEKKYHIVYIGRSKEGDRSNLRVDNGNMNKENKVKYLGDQVDNRGTVIKTVKERRSKAFGISSEILSIVKSVPLGQ